MLRKSETVRGLTERKHKKYEIAVNKVINRLTDLNLYYHKYYIENGEKLFQIKGAVKRSD